jgi:hypothetical protein
MLILLAVAVALKISTFLLILPHGLVVAIVGVTVGGAIATHAPEEPPSC